MRLFIITSSCENHNHGDPSDGVMGCEFMCSGYANNDVHAIPLDFLSKASLEGCQQCVSSELKNTCSQMPYLMEIDKCTKKEESQDNKYYECASKTAAKYHPKRDECLAKTKDTYICGKIYGIEIWTHPKFDTCMSDTKNDLVFCTSKYPDFEEKLLSGPELFERKDFLDCFKISKNANDCRSPQRISEIRNPQFKECLEYNGHKEKCLDGGLKTFLKKEFKTCMKNMGEKSADTLDFCRQCTADKPTRSEKFDMSSCFQKKGIWNFKSQCNKKYGKNCTVQLVKSFLKPEFESCNRFYEGDFIKCINLSKFKNEVTSCLGLNDDWRSRSKNLVKIYNTATEFYQGRGPSLTAQKCLTNPGTFKIQN